MAHPKLLQAPGVPMKRLVCSAPFQVVRGRSLAVEGVTRPGAAAVVEGVPHRRREHLWLGAAGDALGAPPRSQA